MSSNSKHSRRRGRDMGDAVTRRRYPSERDEQVAVVAWAARSTGARPELDLLYAIPNGGDRDKRVAAKLVGEGVKKGVPDLCLPVARGGFHALYVEMKRKPGPNGGTNGSVTTDAQLEWIDKLRDQGNAAFVCRGYTEARACIERYLDGKLIRRREA